MSQHKASRMPAVFIGHGSPMNALEDNAYTRAWQQFGASIRKPKAILAVSAHWVTQGSAVTAMQSPPTIHDFGGFPQALFDLRYPAPGDPALAARVRDMLAPISVRMDDEWGLDHGVWSILVKMFPHADVPVVQLSIDATQPNAFHLEAGRRLGMLRDEGILLMASGNVVHNLRTMRWSSNAVEYDWARRFNDAVRDSVLHGNNAMLADYAQLGADAQLSVPTPEHFQSLLYVAGARREDESATVLVDGIEMGSISMLSIAVCHPA